MPVEIANTIARYYEYIGERALIGRDAPQCVNTEAPTYIMWKKRTRMPSNIHVAHNTHANTDGL